MIAPEENGSPPMAGENPRCPPDTNPSAAVKTPDQKDKQSNTGCLVLFLLALPLVDTFGMLMSLAGPYCPVVFIIGLGGFACGAALGAYVSVKIMQRRWWSSCRWAIYGLLGMCLPAFIIMAALSRYTH
jgi:hypothetical protein